jgi:hypothetical protein
MTSPYLAYEYATSVARLAATFSRNDIGGRVLDYETGNIYTIMAAGSGAAVMRRDVMSAALLQTILIDLDDWHEVTSGGDVGNIVAIGGNLASDTTPILRGDAAESWEIGWATGDVDPISYATSLPAGFDGTRDVFFDLGVYSGTTDAATFTVETSWDGGTLVSDSCTDTSTKSATRHIVTATIAAADIPDSPSHVTIALTPTNAHATNAYQVVMTRMRHYFA